MFHYGESAVISFNSGWFWFMILGATFFGWFVGYRTGEIHAKRENNTWWQKEAVANGVAEYVHDWVNEDGSLHFRWKSTKPSTWAIPSKKEPPVKEDDHAQPELPGPAAVEQPGPSPDSC